MTEILLKGITNRKLLKSVNSAIKDATYVIRKTFPEIQEIKFHTLYNTNIDISHFKERNWDEEAAIRDLLQNALDEDDEAHVKFDVNRDVYTKDYYTIIRDDGRGLPEEAFTLGGTKQSECYRGGFGEGLKISLGTLLLKGHNPIVAITREGKIYVATFYEEGGDIGSGIRIPIINKWLGILIGNISPKPDLGTAIIIPDMASKLKTIASRVTVHGKTIFQTMMPPEANLYPVANKKPVLVGSCLKKYAIIEPDKSKTGIDLFSEETNVYIGGLLFHPSSNDSMFGRATMYSYDLWANPRTGEIESSRQSYKWDGTAKMAVKFYELWNRFYKENREKAIEAMAEIIRRSSETTTGMILIRPELGELHVPYPYRQNYSESKYTDELTRNLSDLMKQAICKVKNWECDKLATFRISSHEVMNLATLIYELGDINPVIYDIPWPSVTIPDYTDKLYKRAHDLSKKKGKMREYDKTAARCAVQTTAMFFGKMVPIAHVGTPIVEDKSATLGLASIEASPVPVEINGMVYDKWGTIMVSVVDKDKEVFPLEKINMIILHELAHLALFSQAGIMATIPDVTHDFQDSLGSVASTALMYGDAIKSAAYGFLICPKIPEKNFEYRHIARDFIDATNSNVLVLSLETAQPGQLFIEDPDKATFDLSSGGGRMLSYPARQQLVKDLNSRILTTYKYQVFTYMGKDNKVGLHSKASVYKVLNPYELLVKLTPTQYRNLLRATGLWEFYQALGHAYVNDAPAFVITYIPWVDEKLPAAYMKLLAIGSVEHRKVVTYIDGDINTIEGDNISGKLIKLQQKYRNLTGKIKNPSLKDSWRSIFAGGS